MLDGMPEIAEQIFDLPIRRGVPTGVGGLADHVNSPTFATASAWCCYAAPHIARPNRRRRAGGGAFRRVVGPAARLFKEFF